MTVAVELLGVARDYSTPAGLVHAINGVDLSVPAGSQVAVMGPSGCGKSTLLGIIGGLESATSGSVSVLGNDLRSLSAESLARFRRERVGFVFQAYDLLPFLTVAENVRLQAGIAGPRPPGGPTADELLVRLGLGAELDKLPDQLSGGQKQRVGIARCLVHRPSLVLADEPTGQLDSVTSAEVLEILLSTIRDMGATAVVVTHDAGVAARFERTVNMRDGVVVSDTARLARDEATISA